VVAVDRGSSARLADDGGLGVVARLCVYPHRMPWPKPGRAIGLR
jgi:hypothetical protein